MWLVSVISHSVDYSTNKMEYVKQQSILRIHIFSLLQFSNWGQDWQYSTSPYYCLQWQRQSKLCLTTGKPRSPLCLWKKTIETEPCSTGAVPSFWGSPFCHSIFLGHKTKGWNISTFYSRKNSPRILIYYWKKLPSISKICIKQNTGTGCNSAGRRLAWHTLVPPRINT